MLVVLKNNMLDLFTLMAIRGEKHCIEVSHHCQDFQSLFGFFYLSINLRDLINFLVFILR